MKKRARAAALIVMVFAAHAWPQSRAAGTVRGRVVAADNDAPVRKARAALTLEGAPAAEPIYTNSDGEFEFANVAPGRYALTAVKTGYVLARFGARSQFDRATIIAVGAGASVEGLELRLVKSAVISGRILEESGEPIELAMVSVGRLVRDVAHGGRLRFRAVALANTDDLGEYRISGLAAGNYALAISACGGGMVPRTHQTFYPGTPSISEARTVTVRPGEGDRARRPQHAGRPDRFEGRRRFVRRRDSSHRQTHRVERHGRRSTAARDDRLRRDRVRRKPHVPPRTRSLGRPDHTGRFVIEGLPAGEYLAVAVAEVDDLEWATVEYLDRLRSSAARVTIADAEKKSMALECRSEP